MDDLLSIHFGVYAALAFVLYAIHQTTHIQNRYIPMIALGLGVFLSWLQAGSIGYHVLLTGIRYALYGMGTVATIKYLLKKFEE
ncbi:uncharacterized membrane protein YuzA (DUF378 family) [Scopulibacillus daqui]|uniref:Uncharacterized membrane protein YuzA (DUF378 family) n=1 Tax=Scopulibacillus daqui TaxID=1469162 RepID=A0ABS2PVN1_9BACL|nr:phage holin family protein [Scopulibacillus daqui]MBM7644112.1 uncharacterized membrane protein YuzA (DUF378 family) [Scopulibacillus daqui]